MPLRILARLAAARRSSSLRALPRPRAGPATIVRLTAAASCAESATLAAAGAQLVDAKLRLWRLRPDVAGALLPTLEDRGARRVRRRPSTRTTSQRRTATPDPLQAQEWWLSQIGIDGLTPPGPGIPVTIVDSGLDVSHPEFAGRPDIALLNTQEPAGIGGEHGTSVASVIGAPANGVGVIGIYPQAVLRSWDAALGDGHPARVERHRRRNPRRRARRTRRHQPEPRRRPRPRGRARDQRGRRERLARRRRVGQRRRPRQPARLPGRASARHHRGRDRPVAAGSRRSRAALRTSTSRRPATAILVASAVGKNWRPSSGNELLVAPRRGRGRLDLDGAARARRGTARRDPPPLGARHRPAGTRLGLGLRDAERRGGARAGGADQGSVRAERRRRGGRPERRPLLHARRRR